MNKLYKLIVLAIFLFQGCSNDLYPIGRDTIESFGDGRFKIGRVGTKKFLHDGKTQETIASHVTDWTKRGPWVYVINYENTYTILNYKTGYHKSGLKISDFGNEQGKNLSYLKIN